MHSRRLVTPFGLTVSALLIDCAVGEALVALEVQFQALATTLATPGIVIISHNETDAPCGLLQLPPSDSGETAGSLRGVYTRPMHRKTMSKLNSQTFRITKA